MGCNCGKYQEGGTIEKTRTFNEFEYNKLVDREKKEFFGYWSGYLWDITHKSSPDIVGKFNPKTKILYIFGNSDLNNPLVKWLQDNSKISREEYEKLANGGRLVDAKGGRITSEISKCELEDMVGRNLDGWNDDIIYYGGRKYEKCFLRPHYKVK